MEKDIQTDGLSQGQTYGHTQKDKWTDKLSDLQIGKWTDGQTDEINIQIYIWMDAQMDEKMGGWTGGQRDRHMR